MAHIAVYRLFRLNDDGLLMGAYGQVWDSRRMVAECRGTQAPAGSSPDLQKKRQLLCEKHLQEENLSLSGYWGDVGVPRCRCGIYGVWTTDDFVLGINTVAARCVLFGVVDLWTEMAKASGAIIEEMWCHPAIAQWLGDKYPGVPIHNANVLRWHHGREELDLPRLVPILDGARLIALKPLPSLKALGRGEMRGWRSLRLDGRPWLTLKNVFADGKPHKTAEVKQYWEDHHDDYKKIGLCGDCYQWLRQRWVQGVRYELWNKYCTHKRSTGSGMRNLMGRMSHGPITRSGTLIEWLPTTLTRQRKLKGTGWYVITPFGRTVLRQKGRYYDRRRR